VRSTGPHAHHGTEAPGQDVDHPIESLASKISEEPPPRWSFEEVTTIDEGICLQYFRRPPPTEDMYLGMRIGLLDRPEHVCGAYHVAELRVLDDENLPHILLPP
jgi:hypothetical protein